MFRSSSFDNLIRQYSEEIEAADEEDKQCEEDKSLAVSEKKSCDSKEIALSKQFFTIEPQIVDMELPKELTEYFQQLKALFSALSKKSRESKIASSLDGKLKLNVLHCLFELIEDETAKFSKLINIRHSLKELTLSEEIILNAKLRDLCSRAKDASLPMLFQKITGLRLSFIKEPIHKTSFTF